MLQNPSAEAHRETPRTFADVLTARASDSADHTAFTVLSDGEEPSESVTYGVLHARALGAAVNLTAVSKPGERAILMFPQGIEFIVALFGCFYAGVIPVPVSLPNRKGRLNALARIVQDAGATLMLCPESERSYQGLGNEVVEALRVVDTSCAAISHAHYWRSRTPAPGDVALLQYTSGSTGNPRGVTVTHRNMVANHVEIAASLGSHASTTMVSWLPMFHDMGLALMLAAVWVGAHCVLMSPHAFLQKPQRWLRAISRYRGVISGGPDFAYDLCARRAGELDLRDLDLSSWRVAFNGSEPIKAHTLERFSRAFAPNGFAPHAFHPMYGLAETTVFACSPPASQLPTVRRFSRRGLAEGMGIPSLGDDTTALVGCGSTLGSTRLEVVDPESRALLPPGRVGEIWLRGESVAAGYWDNTDATAVTFGAFTQAGEGPFLRTGDLGFRLGDHVFVTGRSKDLIIIRGANHYPQDIEASVSSCHPALQPNACAAVAVEGDGGEQLVVIQEVARSHLRRLDVAEVLGAIRQAVAEQHGLRAHSIVLVRPASLPRTTSGKVRRRTSLQRFVENRSSARESTGDRLTDDEAMSDRSPVVARWTADSTIIAVTREQVVGERNPATDQPPATAAHWRDWITAWLSRRLEIAAPDIDQDRPLAELGLDSVAAVQLVQALSERSGAVLEETLLFRAPTVTELAQLLVERTTLLARAHGAGPALAHRAATEQAQPVELSTKTALEEELDQLEKELRNLEGKE